MIVSESFDAVRGGGEGRGVIENKIAVNSIILDHARDILQVLWTEMLNELNTLGRQGHFTPSLLVSKVRDYNRKWNKKADEDNLLLTDGFKKFAKKQLIKQSKFGDEYITALRYL